MAKYQKNSCCLSFIKHLFVCVQGVFLLAGIAIIAMGVHVRTAGKDMPANAAGPDVHDYGHKIAIALFVLGGVVTLVSFLGCCGAMSRSKCILCLYFVLLVLLIAAQVAVGVVVYHAAKDHSVKDRLSKTWHSADNDWRNSVQSSFDCCGFVDPADAPGTVCPGTTASNVNAGCFPKLKHDIQHILHVVVIVAIAVASVELFCLLASFCLLCCLNTRREDPAAMGLLNTAYEPQSAYRPTYSASRGSAYA